MSKTTREYAGCCGALHLHSGYMDDAKSRARALVDALEPSNMDAFVVNSAGCGSTLKEYGELLARHGFERIETGNLVATYMRSKFEDTRRKALKFGANGSTVKAFKPGG